MCTIICKFIYYVKGFICVKDVIIGCAKRLETNIIVKLRVTSNFLNKIISFIIYAFTLTKSL